MVRRTSTRSPTSDACAIVMELPRDPLLRALAIYGIIGFAVLLAAPVVIAVFGLPQWLSSLVIMSVILAAPVVAAGAWLIDRRR
jgi:hypothetical protein